MTFELDLPDLTDIPAPEDLQRAAPSGTYLLELKAGEYKITSTGLPMLNFRYQIVNEGADLKAKGVNIFEMHMLALWKDKNDTDQGMKGPLPFMVSDLARRCEVLNIGWNAVRGLGQCATDEDRISVFAQIVEGSIGTRFVAEVTHFVETYEGEEREKNKLKKVPAPGTVEFPA